MGNDIPLKEEKRKELDTLAKSLREMLADDIAKNAKNLFEVTLKATDGVRIEIHPRDHIPPNFHVKYGDNSAVYHVDTCELLRGGLSPRANRIVKDWYDENRAKVIDVWNKTRPGIISIGESYLLGAN